MGAQLGKSWVCDLIVAIDNLSIGISIFCIKHLLGIPSSYDAMSVIGNPKSANFSGNFFCTNWISNSGV